MNKNKNFNSGFFRPIAMSLFTLMNFVGAFKEGAGVEGFGSGNPLKDYTFLTVLGIVVCFGIIFLFSNTFERRAMIERMFSLSSLICFGIYFALCQFLMGSEAGFSKLRYFWMLDLPACFIFVSLIRKPQDLKAFLWFIVLFSCFLTMVAFIYKTQNPFLFLSSGNNEGRTWTYIQYGALSCSAGLIALIWSVESTGNLFSKIVSLFICLLNFAGTIYSGERGSILFVPIIFICYLFMSGRLIRLNSWKAFWIGFIIIIISFSAFSFIQSEKGEMFRKRFEKLGVTQDSDDKDARLDIQGEFGEGIRQATKKSPIFGLGPGNYFGFNQGGYPHNMILETGGELGLIGLAIYFFILSRVWKGVRCIKNFMQPDLFYAYFVVFLLYFFRTLKTGDIAGSRYFWLFIASWLLFSNIRNLKKPGKSGGKTLSQELVVANE